jgi:phosphatidylcholine synthase
MNTPQVAAWAVHLYTAVGAFLGLLALDAIARADYQAAFAWMTIAVFVDSTDGVLARRARVKTVLPHFDGARLDDIVDYLNYVVVPLALLVHAGHVLPSGSIRLWIAAAPLLASAYGFCQSDAKTEDHFFKGFPSYWNVVALYLFVLRAPLWFNCTILVLFAALVFVPVRYLYPSRSPVARKQTIFLGVVWAALVVGLLVQFPEPSRALALCSLFFPAYYLGLSLHLHRKSPPAAGRASGSA